jgi:hypothetical protein
MFAVNNGGRYLAITVRLDAKGAPAAQTKRFKISHQEIQGLAAGFRRSIAARPRI